MDPERFASRYPFPLDDYQRRSIEALALGESVLVAAPTGSGKTVVAEYAIEQALSRGRKAFYTTPLKALSNQKYGDFVARYGASEVGLLTGDNSINSEASIVVMTTEILRNMLYQQSSTLRDLEVVVMDEVHYLQDPYRGPVWEEILIHLDLVVSVVALSATVSNAEEFGEWLTTLRGATRVIVEERRPVPLEHLYMTGRELHPMHVEEDGHLSPNPYLVSLSQRELRVKEYHRRDGRRYYERRGRPREGHRRVYVPRREEVIRVLEREGILPAIYFVFSRAGCDRSVEYAMEAGIRLTSAEEQERIREFVEMRTAWMDEEDLQTLGFYELREAMTAGVAAHHAGMLPVFKETVEELFARGLVKIVFATETLSLGINMPAKTVVIEDLFKFTGERHEVLTPGEYTQLTGRAGRRGIDDLGYAVVLHQRQVEFERVAGLASQRTYELTSSFRPSYNMTVNLVRNYTLEEARHLLNSSFGQFQADRAVVALERQAERDRAGLSGYSERLACDRGDFEEYWGMLEEAQELRREADRTEERRRQEEIKNALGRLRPGDVIFVPRARRRGLAVVLANREGRPSVLTQDRKAFRATPRDFQDPPESLARVQLPKRGSARSARYRRDVSAKLVSMNVRPPKRRRGGPQREALSRAEELEGRARKHPVASCPDLEEHERWARRASKLRRRVRGLERRIRARTDSLARQLDRVLEVLTSLGYVSDFSLTPKGERLTRIYGEGDILVAEAIEDGVLDGLTPAEVAALVSTVVYESRERTPRSPTLPTVEVEARFERLRSLYLEVRRAEERAGVELCRELDAGFAEPAFHWAEGKALEDALRETEMAPGDFVRTCKQLIDLLRMIEDVADEDLASRVHEARTAVNRGVVAYTGL
ncbi:MAG TPA: DEAD/DEAH box helicase [Actinomycetota bacterium]